jgi:hydrogenase-4 component F
MTILAYVLVAGPLAGTVAAASGARARAAGWASVIGACVTLAAAVWLVVGQLHRAPLRGLGGYLYVDSLSCFFVLTVAVVTVLAATGSVGYLSAEETSGRLSRFQIRLYYVFFGLFASLMLASLETGNLGLLFVLIEASTLASAALVGLEGKASSLEAAWKYVIISSLGVTIALAGTLFLFYSASGLHLPADLRLTWPYLFGHASALAPASLRLAFLLAVVGYGTKVGLAPMHTWLPDAHAEAPSPASAMLSAALLNTGMYAIIRFLAIARAGLGEEFPRVVLLVFGFLSVIIGVLFMVRRGNFKRLFAYSSVEHMGIIAVALGFGGVLGLYGALLHTLNHAIAKAVLFLTSGDVALRYRSRESADAGGSGGSSPPASTVSGLLAAAPVTGAALLLGSFAVLGSPPFGLFLSEFTIVRAGFAAASPVLPLLLLALLAVAFVAFARTTTGMATGEPAPETPGASPYGGRGAALAAVLPVAVGLVVLLVLGLWIPAGLGTLISHSITVL